MEIEIRKAAEHNLKKIDVDIPKDKFTVITGLSGSGKTTLVKDVLYTESQRQYLESMNYQGIQKPSVDSISNLSPAILIDQENRNDNSRSTLGTQTDIYTDLRMIFEKIHSRTCPSCSKEINASECLEETEKKKGQFTVYMHCPHCKNRMEKITRSHFSFNTKEGACQRCHGLGNVLTITDHLYDRQLSVEEGAIRIWQKAYAEYQLKSYHQLLDYLAIPLPVDLPLSDFSPIQFELLKKGIYSKDIPSDKKESLPTKVQEGKFEGVEHKIWEKLSEKSGIPDRLKPYVKESVCPECHGEKLNSQSRTVTVLGKRLPYIEKMSLKKLSHWTAHIKEKTTPQQWVLVKDYVQDISTKAKRISQVGLDYLFLNRSYTTLSGGEAQRIKLSAVLDSQMTELIYLLDEPTIGLHPSDTKGLVSMIQKIKKNHNTIIAIEHDEEVMKAADHIIEIGPGSGHLGGNILFTGTYEELLKEPHSLMAQSYQEHYLQSSKKRATNQLAMSLKNGNRNNLQDISVTIPSNCLSVITGVSGSGKSSLLFSEIASTNLTNTEKVKWYSTFSNVLTIAQKRPSRNKRSIVATYIDLFDPIRKLFAKEASKQNKSLSKSDFSFNSGNGRCPQCSGLGKIESNQLFFDTIEITCPQCSGQRYKDNVLEVLIHGKSISDVLNMTVAESMEFFRSFSIDLTALDLMTQTNLSYLKIGQTTDTLSGGEMQRLRLASVISKEKENNNLFLMDEPSTGMHKIDVYHFMNLIHTLTDKGNTFIFIEHNLDIIKQADYVIELGPEGGENGGKIIFEGDSASFQESETLTSQYISAYNQK